jgi:mannosyltransferase OCH1-like enzyme
MSTIPKIIHYCWFGNTPLPQDAQKCIETWKALCPDYFIKRWDESNIDISANEYVQKAYTAKKFAFVSDYARLYVLHAEGGIYLDTDVEIVKPFDTFLSENAFACYERPGYISTGILGAKKENEWIKYLLSYYESASFYNQRGEENLTTNVVTISKLTEERYSIQLGNQYTRISDIVTIYPNEYFSPKDFTSGEILVTDHTFAIHHYAGSWLDDISKKSIHRSAVLSKYLGEKLGISLNAIIYNFEKGGIRGVLKKLNKKNRTYI